MQIVEFIFYISLIIPTEASVSGITDDWNFVSVSAAATLKLSLALFLIWSYLYPSLKSLPRN